MGMHRLPTNNSDFLKVSGVGFTKLTKYSHELLTAIQDYLAKG